MAALVGRTPGTILALTLVAVGPRSADGAVTAALLAGGFSRPVFATSPPGDTERLFVVEQHTGRIRIVRLPDGSIDPTDFLDLGGLATGNEQGLLGLAFHPDYASNGWFYVNLTVSGGDTEIRRYRVSVDPDVADAASATLVLGYAQPQGNHNGGWHGAVDASTPCDVDGRLTIEALGIAGQPVEIALEAALWKPIDRQHPERGCRYRRGPVVAIAKAKAGRVLKVVAGADDLGVPLAVDPRPVRIEIAHGDVRSCVEFGGEGGRYVPDTKLIAKRTPIATGCPRRGS